MRQTPGHGRHRLARALARATAIGANPFLLGFAYQKGLLPVQPVAALRKRAIELNGARWR